LLTCLLTYLLTSQKKVKTFFLEEEAEESLLQNSTDIEHENAKTSENIQIEKKLK